MDSRNTYTTNTVVSQTGWVAQPLNMYMWSHRYLSREIWDIASGWLQQLPTCPHGFGIGSSDKVVHKTCEINESCNGYEKFKLTKYIMNTTNGVQNMQSARINEVSRLLHKVPTDSQQSTFIYIYRERKSMHHHLCPRLKFELQSQSLQEIHQFKHPVVSMESTVETQKAMSMFPELLWYLYSFIVTLQVTLLCISSTTNWNHWAFGNWWLLILPTRPIVCSIQYSEEMGFPNILVVIHTIVLSSDIWLQGCWTCMVCHREDFAHPGTNCWYQNEVLHTVIFLCSMGQWISKSSRVPTTAEGNQWLD